jgi:hypothetical protein
MKEIAQAAAKIPREKIPATVRPVRDELIACLAMESRQGEMALTLAREIPRAEVSPTLSRLLESAAFAEYQQAMLKNDVERALPAWRVLVTNCPRADLRDIVSKPIQTLATTPVRRRLWVRSMESLMAANDTPEELKNWLKTYLADAEKVGR